MGFGTSGNELPAQWQASVQRGILGCQDTVNLFARGRSRVDGHIQFHSDPACPCPHRIFGKSLYSICISLCCQASRTDLC